MRDQAACVELGEDAAEAELIPQALEIISDDLRRADDGPAAPRFVPGQRLQPLGSLDPPRGVEDAGAVRRFFQPRAQVALETHQALFGARKRLFDGISDIDLGAQINLAVARVTRGL